MKQQIDLSLWKEFEQEQKQTLKKLEEKARVQNSGKQSQGEWTRKIVEKIRISELASERGIETCPEGHKLYFDDSRGWFCCAYVKWGVERGKKSRCFSGNIVDFTKWLMGEW